MSLHISEHLVPCPTQCPNSNMHHEKQLHSYEKQLRIWCMYWWLRLVISHSRYSLFGSVCFSIWGHLKQSGGSKKKKKKRRENNQAHLTIKSNVWKTAASLAQKASTSAANSRVKHVVMHFISIYVTAQEPFPKWMMPLALHDSFLREIPGVLSIAQPWWRFRTKTV